ncbi:MAG: peptide chain release factor 2 [Enterobacteriaceae bacterium PSpicST2]|nr:MAG: peptide chain release factor 2 [Enterobacteriaceae bacterium PSpicST2]WMC19105.1 MAG: peptide chain release factor 2 [Enterobacteriaceae bacterium PSpicST1]
MIKNNFLNYKIQKILKNLIYIKKKINYIKKKKRLIKINNEFKKKNLYSNYNFFLKLKKEINLIENIFKKIIFLKKNIYDNIELLEIFKQTKDKSILKYIIKNLEHLNNIINNLENKYIFFKKNDKLNCFLNIKSGSGGIDSQNWCNILLKMYLKWAEKKKFKIEFINKKNNNNNGINSITIKIIGNYAYGWLRTESGIHRLVRKNFLNNKKRHTSFSSVFVYPEYKNDNINNNVNIKESDLRIDLYRSSGSGGQHINKTETAVRITHLPTNIVVKCQNNRSQYINKISAIKQLNLKLLNLENLKKKKKIKKINDNKLNISWSNQVRSYIFDNSIVKDVRTNLKVKNIKYILDGNLDLFIKNNLKAEINND